MKLPDCSGKTRLSRAGIAKKRTSIVGLVFSRRACVNSRKKCRTWNPTCRTDLPIFINDRPRACLVKAGELQPHKLDNFMIKGFEPPRPAEPLAKSHLQGIPAVAAGLIAGVILLIVPHGSPWAGITSLAPAILGRVVPATWGVPAVGAIFMHLALSLIYGVIISLAVINVRELRAVFMGGVVGLALYLLNLGTVSLCLPEMRGNEVSVIVTHGVFGLVAAGAYRGLLRRQVSAAS